MANLYRRVLPFTTIVLLFACAHAFGTSRTSTAPGNWSDASTWSPSGVPLSSDNIVIMSGHTVTIDANANANLLTVNSGGVLTFIPGKKLALIGAFTVNGTVTMNGGDIALLVPNTSFILGANSSFTWDPASNNAANATLFVNGKENFASSSTLIIKKWYNYTTLPLGSVVTGNFGNLVINTNSSGTILEWNQNNQFESHQILGTLTIDQGWVTLDKSGAISNTTIGSIVLKTGNSYFTAYNGTSAPNLTLNTSGITNSGGTFFGIYDGKGNITLNVTGNFINTGNIKLIDNDGLMGSGMCDGNAALTVGGSFSQGGGDTRFIYNLYSTNSGTYSVRIGTLNLTGGIFIGHYSCHTAGNLSSFNVVGSCVINLTNASDKFRCIGLTSIGPNVNNEKLNFTIGNDLTISGNAAAEFTTNASSGDETDSIAGNFQVNNGQNNFNYGSAEAAHTTTIIISGGLSVNGGTTYLSRIAGKLQSTINGNSTITNGTLIVKGDIGNGTLTVNGTFTQSGGKLFHHSNAATPTSDVVTITCNGIFNQSNGTISFDDCPSSTAGHVLAINGSGYNLSGTGLITRAGTSAYGKICFGRQGTIQFNRSANSHRILQTNQYINNGCTLNVNFGNIQLPSSDVAGNYFFKILTGGVANMNTYQLFSNGVNANSAIQVDSGGTLKTGCPRGLYDGSTAACINGNGLTPYLDPYSIIEYNGTVNQVVTGNQKYGILRINSGGTPGINYVYPVSSNVDVRTRLELINGEFNLDGYELIIESGLANAIIRSNGYIKSETNASYNPSILTWQKVGSGAHEFPFGRSDGAYLPVVFDPVSGMGGTVSISTRATPSSDNTPFPPAALISASTLTFTNQYATDQVIDRWWNITADGFTANVTLSYQGSENTMNDSCATGNLVIYQWNGLSWNRGVTSNTGVTSGIGTATINNTNVFSTWMVSGQLTASSAVLQVDSSQDTNADDLVILSFGPNPFSSQFALTYSLYQDGPVAIQLADQSGKIMHNEVVNGVAGSNTYTFIDTYSLAPGIYFFYMTYHGTTTTREMVKI